MSKKAQPVREDHLERKETAYELRVRIGKALNLLHVPSAREVEAILAKCEYFKETGYVR